MLMEEPKLLISITLIACKDPILLTPSTLRPEPQRTNDRTERLDPELNQDTTEIASPIRAKLRMDKPDAIELAAKHDIPPANRPKERILNELAISTCAKTDRQEPTRAKFLTDKLDATSICCTTDKAWQEPNRTKPKPLSDEPKRPKDRTDKLLPC
jgi:hypothetical protein